MSLDYFSFQELAGAVLGLSEEEFDKIIEEDDSQLEDLIYEKFECDFNVFQEIAKALLKFTPPVGSELSGVVYNAFVKDLGDGNVLALLKEKKDME
jgi:hypothetical protein